MNLDKKHYGPDGMALKVTGKLYEEISYGD